ncbi:hypothetical protein V1523DRAFT_442675 [Lipomyces doorenjongii]
MDPWWLNRYSNFGICTSSREERIALTSSSRTIHTAVKKKETVGDLNVHSSLVSSDRIGTWLLQCCVQQSRSALGMVYAEVMKRLHQEQGHIDETCTSWLPIDIGSIHPRWRVHGNLPPFNTPWQHIDPGTLSAIAGPAICRRARKRLPKGTRRLRTSAATAQRVSDRVEKVKRCGSCHRVGHNR